MLTNFNYTFSDEELKQCQDFSAASSKGYYGNRNQFNKGKIANDIIVGKLGEIATFQFLNEKGECSYPDFEIYSAGKKSWAPDLFWGEKKICVKSQEIKSAARYGESWVFQYANKNDGAGRDKEIFNKMGGAETIVSFVSVDLENCLATIKSVNTLEEIVPLFDEPKLEYLRGIKKVIYFDKLQSCKKKI